MTNLYNFNSMYFYNNILIDLLKQRQISATSIETIKYHANGIYKTVFFPGYPLWYEL